MSRAAFPTSRTGLQSAICLSNYIGLSLKDCESDHTDDRFFQIAHTITKLSAPFFMPAVRPQEILSQRAKECQERAEAANDPRVKDGRDLRTDYSAG